MFCVFILTKLDTHWGNSLNLVTCPLPPQVHLWQVSLLRSTSAQTLYSLVSSSTAPELSVASAQVLRPRDERDERDMLVSRLPPPPRPWTRPGNSAPAGGLLLCGVSVSSQISTRLHRSGLRVTEEYQTQLLSFHPLLCRYNFPILFMRTTLHFHKTSVEVMIIFLMIQTKIISPRTCVTSFSSAYIESLHWKS